MYERASDIWYNMCRFHQLRETRMPRIILHAHVYYPELWPELLTCVENLRAEVGSDSLFVVATYPEANSDSHKMLEQSLRSVQHEIVAVPNRGYDVGPFVEYVLNRKDFALFDYVIKIHTKRTTDYFLLFRMFRGAAWRRELLSFCSTRKALRRSLRAFSRAPRLGMIAGSHVISRGGLDYSRNEIRWITRHAPELGVSSRGATVVWGTMFMARTKCLLPLAHRNTLADFEAVDPETAHTAYTLAHWYEDVLAFFVTAQGWLVSDGKLPYPLACLAAKLMFCVGRSWRYLKSFGRL